MGFYDAKPKNQVIKNLEEEKNKLLNKIVDIDSIISNDSDISQRQLGLMDVQSSIMNSLVSVIDLRIDDLKDNN